MKAKTKTEKRTLFVELKLEKLFKKVHKKGEVSLNVKTGGNFENNKLKFLVKEEFYSDGETRGFVLYELTKGLQTRVVPKRKIVTSIKRIIKNLCKMQGYRISFI